MSLINEFVLGFWIWWYYERHRDFVSRLADIASSVASRSGLLVNTRYIFIPLYKDNSIMGRLISLPIRLGMILFGLFLQLLTMAFLFLVWAMYVLAPFLPLILLWGWVIRL